MNVARSNICRVLLGLSGLLLLAYLMGVSGRGRQSLGAGAPPCLNEAPELRAKSPPRTASSPSAQNPAAERTALGATTVSDFQASLRILEAESLRSLSRATILATDASEKQYELHTNTDGIGRLPKPGVWHLEVTSPGHVRREFGGQVNPGELVLELERAGVVEVEVRTETGVAVEGVEVVLVPPLKAGKPFSQDWRGWVVAEFDSQKRHQLRRHAARLRQGLDWPVDPIDPMRQDEGLALGGGRVLSTRHGEAMAAGGWLARTDREGRARWVGLPPDSGYRVGWLETERALMAPHHEFEPYAFEDGRWALRGREIEDVTASLEVQSDAAASVSITVFREASLYGWIDTGDTQLQTPSVVKLFHRSLRSAPGASDLALVQMETAVVPTVAGQFEIHGLEPGKKRISAHWSTRRGHMSFGSLEFEIEAGESRNLGLLRAQSGYEQTVHLVLRDGTGAELLPSEVFAPGAVVEVALGIDTLSEPRGLPGSLSEIVSVPLGESVVLTGLPPGRLYLRARMGDDYEFGNGVDLRLIEPKDRWVECPSPQPEELTFVATRFVEQRLRVRWEGTGPVPRLEAHWLSPTEGLSGHTDLRSPRSSTGLSEYRLLLAAGTYEFLLHANSLEAPAKNAGWFWKGDLVVSENADVIEIELMRGCGLSGRVLDATGAPVARRPVSMALSGWGTPASPRSTYKTMTDEQGAYHISSLPPGTRLVMSASEQGIVTGELGSERTLDLRYLR